MCGIAGFLSSNFSEAQLRSMTNTLIHRGPDAEGYYFDEINGIGLGHRRLKILDLSDKANQPFQSNCEKYLLIFNGEIYNYKDIKKTLNKEFGFVSKTSSDTEIIVEAYAYWGDQFIYKLNGMFAIAIWDIQQQELKLYRDRIGIKPLYYYFENNNFVFASEIKAITNLIGINKLSINKNTIVDLLHLGYSNSDQSIYNEIKKVPKGHAIEVLRNENLRINPFWKLEEQIDFHPIKNEKEVKKTLTKKIEKAVDKRLISDVPLGTFLSGGIDSSLTTAIAQSQSNLAIKSFSIGFEDHKYNEAPFARKVAKHLNTEHYEFILTEKDALSQIDQLISIYDEPFIDSSSIPTLLLSEMAKKHVTVCLSGDGGDEQFLGYGMYNWAKRMDNKLLYLLRKPIVKGLNLTGNNRLKRGALVLDVPSKSNLKSHIFSQEQYLFSMKEISSLLVNPSIYKDQSDHFKIIRTLDVEEIQALYDLNNYLPNDLLVKVDRASMHHSLEVRVPLLDHDVVSYTLNIDSSLKIRNNTSKYILKEILYDFVPKELFNRPKWGFSVPMIKWLKTDLKYLLDIYLSKDMIESYGIVNYKIVEELKTRYFKGEDYLYNRLWALVQIHRFLNSNYN